MKKTSHDHPGILSFLIIKKLKMGTQEIYQVIRGFKYS